MDKTVLAFVEKLEIFKTKIKALHWDANSLSQHELCDDIAERIADFQDQVSEVEQSISGKLPKEMFKPTNQEFGEVGTLKEFVESVIDCTNEFYKKLGEKGDKYIGMRSDCESFLSDMQRKLYLVNFTLKEELKMRLRDKINESRPKNLSNTADVEKFIGRKPKSIKARINQIYRIVKKYGIDSRKYHDEAWQAIDDYYKAITSLGCEVELKPCASMNHADSLESDGGYTDYDEYDHMPRSKQYAIKIMFDDGMAISGYIKCMAAGTVSNPFSSYDTCMVLWPKQNNVLENKNMNKQMSLTESELKQVVKEAAIKILSETKLDYDIDNFSGRWNKSEPSDEEWALADSAANGDYLDDPFHAPNSWDDDEWIDGDKDMENDYSWDLYHRMNNVGKSPIDRQHDIMDAAQNRRDHAAYWTDRDNERGKGLMDKWVNGKRDTDELGDVDFSYDPYKYNESKKPMRVTESELKQVVKEAAMKILSETPLNYDIDNFSGRWNKNIPDDYIDGESEGYFDDPNRKSDIEYDLHDYASEEGDTRPMKDIENDYSWGLYDNQPVAQSPESEYAMSTKAGVPFDVDKAISMRNRGNNWTDRELRHGGRVMDKYVHGKYDGEDVGDAWDDLHYESKKPMKVTESELKTIVREAAMQLINEYNQRMANTKGFIRSTHGHGDISKRRKKATPEERAEARRRLGIPKPEKVAEESIDIDPKNKGKFTATKKATGKSTEELTHSKNPLTRKRAIFAQNAKKWNHKK